MARRVSVVVPATDRPSTLAALPGSARGGRPDEVIVVDDPAGAGPCRGSKRRRDTRDRGDPRLRRLGRARPPRRAHADPRSLRRRRRARCRVRLVRRPRRDAGHRRGLSQPPPPRRPPALGGQRPHLLGRARRGAARRVHGRRRLRRRPLSAAVDRGHRARRPAADLGRILLDPAIQGTHLKEWTLGSMIATDFSRRGVPWVG